MLNNISKKEVNVRNMVKMQKQENDESSSVKIFSQFILLAIFAKNIMRQFY